MFKVEVSICCPSSNFIIAKETSGVGTLIALAVNFPSSSGKTFPTAFPAPVSVITRLRAALRPLLDFTWKLSSKFWSLV